MMRITAYADRLLEDLESLDWTEAIKSMQRNWIGKSEGAVINFTAEGITVPVFFRPDTIFGATYLVLAPEHPLVDSLHQTDWPDGIDSRWTGGFEDPRSAIEAYRTNANQSLILIGKRTRTRLAFSWVLMRRFLLLVKKIQYSFLTMFLWDMGLAPLWLFLDKMNGIGSLPKYLV